MRLKQQAGLTLIEILIVVAVISFLTVTVSTLFAEGMRTYQAGQTAGMVQSDLRFALNYMASHLREASLVNLTIPNSSKVSFNLADGTPVEFYVSPYELSSTEQQIMRRKGVATSQPLCRFVESLEFVLNGRELTITIRSVSSLAGQELGAGLPLILSTVVLLRN